MSANNASSQTRVQPGPPSIISPPSQVRLRRAQKVVELVWADGELTRISCMMLRKSCACAACVRTRQLGSLSLIDAEVAVERLELSGISGLQFHFTDGHYRGLYPWAYLRQLGELAA